MSDLTNENTADDTKDDLEKSHAEYWSKNIKLIGMCLVVWCIVSFGFSILLRPALSAIEIGGTDLGFWFAQQGSILCFLGIIFFYAWQMNKIDHQYQVDDDEG